MFSNIKVFILRKTEFWTVVQKHRFKIYAMCLMVMNATQHHSSVKLIFIFQFDGISDEIFQLGMQTLVRRHHAHTCKFYRKYFYTQAVHKDTEVVKQLTMVALCCGDFKLYSDTTSITSCQLVFQPHNLNDNETHRITWMSVCLVPSAIFCKLKNEGS
jgi:hypothetical protein